MKREAGSASDWPWGPLRTRRQTEVVAGQSYVFDCLEDLDEVIDQMLARAGRSGHAATVRDVCPHFGVVWPAARALAELLAQRLSALDVGSVRILELGCGLGLPSLVAARCGATVLATDRHPMTGAFLQRNAAHNGVTGVSYAALDWRTHADDMGLPGAFDLVVASDVLYDAFQPSALAGVLTRFLMQGSKAVIADPGRRYLEPFILTMEALGVDVRRVLAQASNGRDRQPVTLLELTLSRAALRP